MGGEDSYEAEVIEAPKTKRGKIITAGLSVVSVLAKVKEVALLGPAALLIDALYGLIFSKPRKKKNKKMSATARKILGDD